MPINSQNVDVETIREAAKRFGCGEPVVEALGNGLIHHTWKVEFTGEGNSTPIVLQHINRKTFKEPENIIDNYRLLSECFYNKKEIHIPTLLSTHDGRWYWEDDSKGFWRATSFVPQSVNISSPSSAKEAYEAAKGFGAFTYYLSDLDVSQLAVIIPGFHDLSHRYNEFEQALAKASIQRLLKSTHVIAELRQRAKLVDFYTSIKKNAAYPVRVMHHDCKMSNLLLNQSTREVICTVDLDTVMPGLYFSDVGDMIRSMGGTVNEDSTRWEDIDIRKDFYEAIINGYLAGTRDSLTKEERKHIHHAGLMMLYMQCLRFVTDFLNEDVYYKTTYPEQNLNRALNQLILLEKLEEFLVREYNYVA
jgi:hypothetical protein